MTFPPSVRAVALEYYRFDLPKERIAVRPASPRDHARLVFGHAGKRVFTRFHRLPSLLPKGALLVMNDSKVMRAELKGRTESGAVIHLNAHTVTPEGECKAFAAPARKCLPGTKLTFGDGASATVTEKKQGELTLRPAESSLPFPEMFRRYGEMPLPPYIRKRRIHDGMAEHLPEDDNAYQTVYADEEGSAAAPTAGLHFTENVLSALQARGVSTAKVTLHTGAGTFLPVKTGDVDAHEMHSEQYRIPDATAAAVNAALAEGRPVIAAGTTSLRTLEAAFDKKAGAVAAGTGATALFIRPGYRFHVVSGLLTNFHLPESTLFMLVCAFAGADAMKAFYADAIARECRFFSYGDACLLTRPDTTHHFAYAA